MWIVLWMKQERLVVQLNATTKLPRFILASSITFQRRSFYSETFVLIASSVAWKIDFIFPQNYLISVKLNVWRIHFHWISAYLQLQQSSWSFGPMVSILWRVTSQFVTFHFCHITLLFFDLGVNDRNRYSEIIFNPRIWVLKTPSLFRNESILRGHHKFWP